jgi:ferric enterobactin receptor
MAAPNLRWIAQRQSIIFLIQLITIIPIYSQNSIRIIGKIIDGNSNEGVPFANLTIKNIGNIGTIASKDGSFVLDVPSDTVTLLASSVGYKLKEFKLSKLSTNGLLILKLDEEKKEIEQVTIVTEKEKIIRVSEDISSVKISPKLIAKLPNLGEVDVMRSFQLLPGVSGSNETSAGLYVRGGTPDQNLILFDGMTIYHVDHFYGFFSAFNANTIDDIELYKGGYPARFGGRLSSVLEITGKPADMDKVNFGAGVSLLSANAYLEVPIVKNHLSIQVAARRSYTDLIQTGLYNKIFDLVQQNNTSAATNTTNTGFGRRGNRFTQQQVVPSYYFYDLNSKITWKPTTKDVFYLSLYNGKDELDRSQSSSFGGFRGFGSLGGASSTTTGTNTNTNTTGWGNTGVSAQWNHKWQDNFTSTVFLSYSNYFSNSDQQNSTSSSTTSSEPSTNNSNNTLDNNNVNDLSFRFRNEWNPNPNNHIEFGLEYSDIDIKYKLVFNDTSNLINSNNRGNIYALYAQDVITLFKNLDFNVGLRSNYYNITNTFYNEPRLSATYRIVPGLKFQVAWGLYHQFTSDIIREDVQEGSNDFWLLADNKSIPVGKAIHYIAGLSYEINGFLFDVEGYYKALSGLIYYTLRYTGPTLASLSQPNYFFTGTGYARGIEFLAQKKFGDNTGWLAYTLGQVMNTFPELNNGQPFPALQDQTHEIKAVYSRKLGHFDFSASFIYATGKPYTAPEGQYQITLLDGTKYTYIHVSNIDALRLPAYNKLDIAATYNWFGAHTKNSISLSIFNVYNHTNVWYKEFNINQSQLTVTNVNYLGFTPNISYTLELK